MAALEQPEGRAYTGKAGILAWALAIGTILEIIGLGILWVIGRAFAGMGDGAPPRPNPRGEVMDKIVMAGVLIYFALILVSCLPFMRGKTLRNVGIVAHCLLAVYMVAIVLGVAALASKTGLAEGVGLSAMMIGPFVPSSLGWWMLYRQKRVQTPQIAA